MLEGTLHAEMYTTLRVTTHTHTYNTNVYVHTYTRTHNTNVYVHTYTHTHNTNVYVHTVTHIHTYNTNLYVRTHTHTIQMYTYAHTHALTCLLPRPPQIQRGPPSLWPRHTIPPTVHQQTLLGNEEPEQSKEFHNTGH